MKDNGFRLTDSMHHRRASIHRRRTDGTVVALDDCLLPQSPEIEMDGHGLYTAMSDYLAFLRIWLKDERADGEHRVLRPETVAGTSRNSLSASMIHPATRSRSRHDERC